MYSIFSASYNLLASSLFPSFCRVFTCLAFSRNSNDISFPCCCFMKKRYPISPDAIRIRRVASVEPCVGISERK